MAVYPRERTIEPNGFTKPGVREAARRSAVAACGYFVYRVPFVGCVGGHPGVAACAELILVYHARYIGNSYRPSLLLSYKDVRHDRQPDRNGKGAS
jgi:hypothetical protein